jgi:transcriptional regulator with XRE-family HTH domain
MDEQLAQVIGRCVRATRTANRQTQAVVAGLSGITTDYLYQIERGKKLPTIPVMLRLAEVLGVPLTTLLEESPSSDREPRPTADAAAELYRALTQPVTPYAPPPVDELHGYVQSAWRTWQTSPYRYSKLAAQLPMLVTDVELATRRCQPGDTTAQQAVHGCAVDLYGLLRTVAKRLGRLDLSLLVADRAIRAAEAADDHTGSPLPTGIWPTCCSLTGRPKAPKWSRSGPPTASPGTVALSEDT